MVQMARLTFLVLTCFSVLCFLLKAFLLARATMFPHHRRQQGAKCPWPTQKRTIRTSRHQLRSRSLFLTQSRVSVSSVVLLAPFVSVATLSTRHCSSSLQSWFRRWSDTGCCQIWYLDAKCCMNACNLSLVQLNKDYIYKNPPIRRLFCNWWYQRDRLPPWTPKKSRDDSGSHRLV